MCQEARPEFSTTRKRLGMHSSYRRRAFASNRKISKYSQISVTISPNAPYHSMYLGAPMRTPVSIMSKSSTRFRAAIATTNRLKAIAHTPANQAADHPRHARPRRIRMRHPPSPSRRGHYTEQQQARLVHRALQGHRIAADSDLAAKSLLIQRRIRSTQRISHVQLPRSCTLSLRLRKSPSKSHTANASADAGQGDGTYNQRSGSANGNRTRILALKGLRANRCTIAPLRDLHPTMPSPPNSCQANQALASRSVSRLSGRNASVLNSLVQRRNRTLSDDLKAVTASLAA